jgi:heat shock protein HspQ
MTSDDQDRDTKAPSPTSLATGESGSGEPIGRDAKFSIGQVVRHRFYPFRGVIFDVDSTFSNTEEWYQSIPENVRPARDQPYYHLLAESEQTTYEAYVSEQNLVVDDSGEPCRHPLVEQIFEIGDGEPLVYRSRVSH